MTNTPAGKLTVLAGKKFACIKVAGRANFTLGMDFQALLNELRDDRYNYVVMDLSECLLMDSTFLGILTGYGLKMSQANGNGAPCIVELFNPNSRVKELLENMGVLHLFRICQGTLSVPEKIESSNLEATRPNHEQITRTCLEAHQTLMSLNAENAARFKDVAKFLAEELKKHKGEA
jgi:anti-anti-sigma regulatory factor